MSKAVRRRLRVVAALIVDPDHPDQYVIQQRLPDGPRPLLWEFPGGKVEAGESDEQALVRECEEELGVTLEVGTRVGSSVHEYPEVTIELVLYRAVIRAGVPRALHARELASVTVRQMGALPFCEADVPLLKALASRTP
jgi:8-oxo-dGTP diphosphatase